MRLQSLQFIIAAADFEALCFSGADESTEFDTFVGIVDRYIKDNSPFEVNIDSQAKRRIIRAVDAASFKELSPASSFTKLEMECSTEEQLNAHVQGNTHKNHLNNNAASAAKIV